MPIFRLLLLLQEKLELIGIFLCNEAKNLNFLTTSVGLEDSPAIHLGTVHFRNYFKAIQLKLHAYGVYLTLLRAIVCAKFQWKKALKLQNILISIIIAEKLIKFVFLLFTGIINSRRLQLTTHDD